MIKNLIPRLAEVGKIKCGIKGEMKKSQYGKEFMLPKKLDHFIITTLERDSNGHLLQDNALMKKLKNGNDKITEIPIRLLYDDIDLNFQTRYALYSGNKCICAGDGEKAADIKKGVISCPCNHQDPEYTGNDKCKINGTLVCLIDGAEKIGGCYKFRTTSYNSVTNILSSLIFIKTITCGKLAWIPLVLTLAPKSTTIPGKQQNTTVYCASIEFRGSVSELQHLGLNISKQQIEYKVNIDHIEETAKKQLLITSEDSLEAQEIQEEFYPENIEQSMNEFSVADFDATIPKNIDQQQLDDFLKACANQFNRSISDIKAEAAEDPDEFWKAFFAWQQQQKKEESEQTEDENISLKLAEELMENLKSDEQKKEHTANSSPKENPQSQQKIDKDALIAAFKNKQEKGLLEFEATHRKEIITWPSEVVDSWCDKFERTIGENYHDWVRKRNNEELRAKGLKMVMCPVNNEAKTPDACIYECPDPDVRDKEECLARWPE